MTGPGPASEPVPPVLDANGDPVTVPDHIVADEAFREFMAGRVPAPGCPHYMPASEARAGLSQCERCQW